jgi:hypothetical protein
MNLPSLGRIISEVITGVGDEFHSIPPQIVQGQIVRTLNRHDPTSASAA